VKRITTTAIVLTSLVACQRSDLARSWQIDRTRVLAVKAEVIDQDGATSALAEAQPGETIRLSALIVHPDAATSALWIGCDSEEASPFGCTPSEELFELLGALDPLSMTAEEIAEFQAQAQALGLIGIEPFMPPSYTFSEDFLDHLTESESLEGAELQLTIMANPITEHGEPDASDTEIATKRIPVSTSTTPNHNPDILQLLINGQEVSLGQDISVVGGEQYEIEPILSEEPEEYLFVYSDGESEVRTEEPYFDFYATDGSYDIPYSLYGEFQSVVWTAPEADVAENATIWVVSRDRRGGMGWIQQTFLIE
jgi:hypothetical protein